ncbi:MAG: tetratricopeptide repeat protein [Bifidobacteriaceae bacterium]|jgi:putative thioredoxin|nr:tetratricopeptide repeat protein [Bifidobacteriaceae bacterium]
MSDSHSSQPAGGRFADSSVLDLAATPKREADAPTPVIAVTDASFPQVVEHSTRVPVILDLWARWCEPCKTLTPALEQVAREYAGRFLLATIDIDAAPKVAQTFGVQSVPTVVALIAGKAVPLFSGAQPVDRIRPIVDEVLKVAASQGVTGTVAIGTDDGAPPAPAPLPPLHRQAVEAIEAGDPRAAAAAYREAIAQNPGDGEAKTALASVELMIRVDGVDEGAAFAAAAADPTSVDKALVAADLEVASAAPAAAFDRLMPLVRATKGPEREALRTRLVDYFDIVGTDNPEVAVARRALATALY